MDVTMPHLCEHREWNSQEEEAAAAAWEEAGGGWRAGVSLAGLRIPHIHPSLCPSSARTSQKCGASQFPVPPAPNLPVPLHRSPRVPSMIFRGASIGFKLLVGCYGFLLSLAFWCAETRNSSFRLERVRDAVTTVLGFFNIFVQEWSFDCVL